MINVFCFPSTSSFLVSLFLSSFGCLFGSFRQFGCSAFPLLLLTADWRRWRGVLSSYQLGPIELKKTNNIEGVSFAHRWRKGGRQDRKRKDLLNPVQTQQAPQRRQPAAFTIPHPLRFQLCQLPTLFIIL